MERLTIIEYDADHAMHARCFEATARGSCLQQFRDFIDRLLPSGPPATLRLSLHPRPHESVVLACVDGQWGVTSFARGVALHTRSDPSFTEAAADFAAIAGRDGGHWAEVDPRPSMGAEFARIRSSEVLAWVRQAGTRIEQLTARQFATAAAAGGAVDALQAGDVPAALTLLSAAQERAPLMVAALTALADLLDQVQDDDPPSYVTALEAHARAVIVAAGLRPARREAEAEPIAA